MKTFLGFTTGLLSGAFAGMVFMAVMLLESEELRELVNTLADDPDYI